MAVVGMGVHPESAGDSRSSKHHHAFRRTEGEFQADSRGIGINSKSSTTGFGSKEVSKSSKTLDEQTVSLWVPEMAYACSCVLTMFETFFINICSNAFRLASAVYAHPALP